MSPHSERRRHVLLIHGGLAEDTGVAQFWLRPGIASQLERYGWRVVAPDRETTPSSWSSAAAEMAELIEGPHVVVAASNGVSVALRLAIDRSNLVSRVVLLWPATAGDHDVDREVPEAAAHLLAGETVRGVTDAELAGLRVPMAVMASDPEDRFHRHLTVERLVDLVPGATRIEEEFPESPRPAFTERRDEFMTALLRHLD